jgi:type III secretion protein C
MMPGKMLAISRSITGLLIAGTLANIALPAHAAQPPFPNKRVTIVANGKSLQDTLRDLFSQTGLNVSVSSAVVGGTNGRWTDTPAEIWRQLSRANNLVAYYDGSLVRIYSGTEITSRTINAADPKAVEAQAARLGLTGHGNSVKASKNAVIASGVPAFLTRITDLASRSAPPVAPPPVIASTQSPVVPSAISKAPVASDIVSPLNKAPAAAPRIAAAAASPLLASEQPYELSYTVSRNATPSYPYEIRIYNLKWTKPNDKIINAGDFDIIIPGVATLLRQVMGGGSEKGVEIVQRGTQGASQYNDGPPVGPYGPAPYGYPAPYPQQQQQGQQQPAASPDSPSITANPAGNGVIVVDRPAKMGNYDALVRNFDRPRSHVEIDVMMVDLATSNEKTLGVEWDIKFGGLGGVFTGTSSLGGGGSGSNISGSFSKGNTLGIIANISALSKKGRAQVTTRSNMTTLENEPAVSDNRTTVPVRFSGQYQGGIRDYRVGVFTAIAPQVAKDADGLTINMQLDIRTGSITGFQPDGTPFFNQGLLTNSVSIRQGESLIVSGLTVESEFEDSSKIPLLGDIPAAGQLFRKKNKGKSRIERVMIVTPRVQSLQANTIAASNAQEDEDEEESEELANRKKSKKRASKKKVARTAT